jgi:hypothetical protein
VTPSDLHSEVAEFESQDADWLERLRALWLKKPRTPKALVSRQCENCGELSEDLKTLSFCAVGKKYNVSDNTIRNWLNYRGIE